MILLTSLLTFLGLGNPSKDSLKKYYFYNNQLIITAPNDWNVVDNGKEPSIDNGRDLSIFFTLMEGTDSSNYFNEFCKIKLDGTINHYGELFKLIDNNALKLSTNYKIKYNILRHKNDEIILTIIAMNSKSKYLSLTFSSIPDKFEEHKKIIEQIVNTLEIK